MSFEDTERVVQSLKLWLGEQKMHVLWHQHIAEEEEAVAFPELLEDLEEYGAGGAVA